MVQVLEAVPSFGTGLAQALTQATGSLAQGLMQRSSMSQLQNLLTPQTGTQGVQAGQTPQSPLQQIFAQPGGPKLGQVVAVQKITENALGKEAGKAAVDYLLNQQKMTQKQEFEREKMAAKPLGEMAENLRTLEAEDMRFARLGELFSPENEKNFPSSLTTALFTKNGEIRPTALSQLSPEAQESIKLVQDQLSGAKDTYGARVTNFDVQNYLKRLPSLINTAEGRRRVLRDLRLINKLNRLHDENVLNIVEEFGGEGKISLNKAEGIFRKRFKDQIKDLQQEFINPEKKTFNELPDPSLYNGRTIEDEFGNSLRSNGKEWVPGKI